MRGRIPSGGDDQPWLLLVLLLDMAVGSADFRTSCWALCTVTRYLEALIACWVHCSTCYITRQWLGAVFREQSQLPVAWALLP